MPVDHARMAAVRCASMKKRTPTKKRAAKPTAAAKKKTGSAKAKKPVAKVAAATTAKAAPYTPSTIKGDGWPPFRYPLQ